MSVGRSLLPAVLRPRPQSISSSGFNVVIQSLVQFKKSGVGGLPALGEGRAPAHLGYGARAR